MHQSVKRRRGLIAVTGATIAAIALAGCVASERGDDDADAGGDVDGTFVFAASSDPASLDPAFAQDGESFRVSRQIFEGLVGTKPARQTRHRCSPRSGSHPTTACRTPSR